MTDSTVGSMGTFSIGSDTVDLARSSKSDGSQFVHFNGGYHDEYEWTSAFLSTDLASGSDDVVPAWFQRPSNHTVDYDFSSSSSGVQIGIFDVDSGEVVEVTASSGGSTVTVTLDADGEMIVGGDSGANSPVWDSTAQTLTAAAGGSAISFAVLSPDGAVDSVSINVIEQAGQGPSDGVLSTVFVGTGFPDFPNCGAVDNTSTAHSWGTFAWPGQGDITVNYTNVGPRSQPVTIVESVTGRFRDNTPLATATSTTVPTIRHMEPDTGLPMSADPSIVTIEFSDPTSDFFLGMIDFDHGNTEQGGNDGSQVGAQPGDGDIVTLTARASSGTEIDLDAHATVEDACDYTTLSNNPSPTPLFDASTGKIYSRDPDLGNRNILVLSFDTAVKSLEFELRNPIDTLGSDHVYYTIFHSTSPYPTGPGCSDTDVVVTQPIEAQPPEVVQLSGIATIGATSAGIDPVDRMRWFLQPDGSGAATKIASAFGSNLEQGEQTASFDTELFENGTYTLYADARTAPYQWTPHSQPLTTFKSRSSTSSSITVEIDNSAAVPALEITAPTEGEELSGDTLLTVETDPALNIQAVKWSFDGDDVATDNMTGDSSFQSIFETFRLADGQYELKARGKLPSGWSGGPSQTITVTIRNLEIVAPSEGATVSGTFSSTVDTNSALSIQAVKWSILGTDRATDNTAPGPFLGSIDTTEIPNGTYELKARAKLPSGWSGGPTSTIMVTIAN